MLSISSLTYSFSEEKKLDYEDWSLKNEEHALILGSSGSGKTTLLHLMAGLLSPTAGRVEINDVDLSALSQTALDEFRGKHLGLVFQKPHLIQSLSVIDNLRLAAFLGNKGSTSEKSYQLLDELGLTDLANRRVHQISQGQAQRVAIARALVNRPKVIFCDEPTASLDDQSCDRVLDLLNQQAERFKASLVIATHDQRIKSSFQNQIIL